MLILSPYDVVNGIPSLNILGETYNHYVFLMIFETEGSSSLFRGAGLISKQLIQSLANHFCLFLMSIPPAHNLRAAPFGYEALLFLALFKIKQAIHTLLYNLNFSEISDSILFITRTITFNWFIAYIEQGVNEDYLHILPHESGVSRLGLKFNHI